MPTISDHKRQTLEAIQQRYAAAKAKQLQGEQLKLQQNKDCTPKPKFDPQRKLKTPESTPCQTSAQLPMLKGLTQATSSHKQKPSASSGEETNPIYSELSFALHGNLSQDNISDLDSTDLVQSALYDIIQKGGAGKITKGAKKLKLEKGILLDNYVQRGPRLVDAQSRSLLIHSKRSKRHMSLKQHKKCGSFHLHDTFHRFDLYKPMHEMWKEYMRELTKSTPKKQLAESLLSSDLHGALLIVAQCKAALYEGVSGIMICDTAETFGIISEDNHFRVVPKAGSVFVLQADCWKVTLMGDKLSPKETLKENQRQQRAQSLIR
ncbi:uncharacterized protein LOC100828026 isoform X4 [Brachypodium distachyon]|uniref:uncharacterized protein LOC100828026 isoform X4 n=1 Tax=Brachypodium distachyon TaxID=15368 RepID=UPI00071CD9F0|nr:uncharacterized protein LOC100828026 isoform X4 [Brachypodium distachyon]|eukprot:XP_014757563.1 uncharacterized protein LOC100828026 isoform X4 [Brachypodium distachyon]